MTKQLYEEALADVKQVKDVAENNAKRAIMDAVTPRIRELIEEELFREHGEDVEIYDELGASAPADGEVLVDLVAPSADTSAPASAVSAPDAQGKVTLDLDALTACPAPVSPAVEPPTMGAPAPAAEYELSLESIEVLTPVLKEANTNAVQQRLLKLSETVKKLSESSDRIKRTVGNYRKIARMISYVENMYGYVQEAVDDPAQKDMFEKKLETSFADLSRLQESMMAKTKKLQMNEADVTLKLTGLPDDLDLDSVGVDLMTGEDEEGDLGADAGEAGGDEVDLSSLGGDEAPEGEIDMGEGLNLSDDTIVEIDETMLRNEIARIRSLREETKPQSWGNKVGTKEMDDFGGGKDDGDPVLDHEPTTAGKVGEPLGEADDQMDEEQEQMEEQDDLDEMDGLDQLIRRPREIHHPTHVGPEDESAGYMDEMEGMDQLQNRRKGDQFGSDVADGHATPTWDKRRHESLSRRAAFEKRLQERAKSRAAALKKEHARATGAKDAKKSAALKKEYADVAKRFNESLARSKKISKQLVESKKLHSESLQNGASRQPAEQSAVEESLRTKLAETNLFNAKLIATNKLLQNDSLTSRQKAQVIEQLEGANSLREVKLVYDSLVKTLKPVRPLAEGADRKVVGSASRATRPASTQALNEGIEAERWAKLAGIVK